MKTTKNQVRLLNKLCILKFQKNTVWCWSRFQEVHAEKEGRNKVRKRQNGARLSKR